MRYLIPLALGALGLSGPAFAAASDTGCPGFQADTTSPTDIDHFYGMRAVEIMRAAGQGDTATLNSLISPDLVFKVSRGDSTFGGRAKGAEGVVEVARLLRAESYQFVSAFAGPIGIVSPPAQCRASVTILWRTAEGELGVSIVFDFAEGRLIRATGDYVTIFEGGVSSPR